MANRIITYSSSLRLCPLESTLQRAKALAPQLGITRVTDITRLDRVGIPVFVSIRPGASAGSLCVNAGKGLTPAEAEVGAYMEAIEFALAEPSASRVKLIRATARDVLDGHHRPEAILDFCPTLGARIRLDEPLDCVEAVDVLSGIRTLVPAEAVFLPYRPTPSYRSALGSNSNGLCSGNTTLEAMVHGLAELIERDIRSFQGVRDTSLRVDLDSTEGPARELVRAVRDAGLELYVRYQPNLFQLPYFMAVVADPDMLSPFFVNGGYGCHPHRSIALVRAICESLQSRLSFIHGGRDDLQDRYDHFKGWSYRRRAMYATRTVQMVARGAQRISLDDVPDYTSKVGTVENAMELLLNKLELVGLKRVYRCSLTHSQEHLQVLRVIVPKLEFFNESSRRVGVRLREHAQIA